MNRSKIIVFTIVILLSMSCENKSEQSTGHKVKFIKVSNNVSLELLDWGGNGTSMFFLSGLGNTAHVYDEFAYRFTDKFHVYALTRRGFGSSSQPKDGYDLKTLTQDIIAVLDQLHLKKVILVGHSIAGEEITKVAIDYPGRIDKIIYLDAAYDRTEVGNLFALMPEFPIPNAKDSTSFQAIKKFTIKTNGITLPDEELEQTMVFSKEGKYLKDVTPASIVGSFFGIVVKPDYKKIKCRALAIYAKHNSVRDLIPFYETLDSINKNKANQVFNFWREKEAKNPNQFLKESRNGIVKKLNGDHYIFLSNPNETEKLIRDFLN